MGTLDEFAVDLTCPACRKKTTQKLGRLKAKDKFVFPCCGYTCDTKAFAKDLAAANKAVQQLGRDLKNLSK